MIKSLTIEDVKRLTILYNLWNVYGKNVNEATKIYEVENG